MMPSSFFHLIIVVTILIKVHVFVRFTPKANRYLKKLNGAYSSLGIYNLKENLTSGGIPCTTVRVAPPTAEYQSAIGCEGKITTSHCYTLKEQLRKGFIMDTIKKQRFCQECKRNVYAERPTGISDGIGCLLIVITAGLFLPFFLLLRTINAFSSYKCPICGSETFEK